MRRVSDPAYNGNGVGRVTPRGVGDYFNIAQGSIEESRYYRILAEDLQYGDVDEWHRLLEKVSKLLEVGARHAVPLLVPF